MKRHLQIAEEYLVLGASLAIDDFTVQLYANDTLLLSHGRSAQVDAARALIERIELAHESPAAGSN